MLFRSGGGLIFITAVLNFYVFQVSVVATSAYEVQALDRERDTWKARNQQLELELSKAQSLRWVEYDATQRLGLGRGDDPVYLKVETYRPLVKTPSTLSPDAGDFTIGSFKWEWLLPVGGE